MSLVENAKKLLTMVCKVAVSHKGFNQPVGPFQLFCSETDDRTKGTEDRNTTLDCILTSQQSTVRTLVSQSLIPEVAQHGHTGDV